MQPQNAYQLAKKLYEEYGDSATSYVHHQINLAQELEDYNAIKMWFTVEDYIKQLNEELLTLSN